MLHVIIGAPCSGKSTYAREHANGDVVIDFDMIAKALGSQSDHDAPKHVKRAAFAARDAAISKCMEDSIDAWVIHTKPTEEQMKAYEESGADFIYMDTDMDTCLERCANDERPPGTQERIYEFYGKEPPEKGGFFRLGGEMRRKSFDLKVKEAHEDRHSITAYASTFHREPDSYGDVVAKGAFSEWIAQTEREGKKVPLLFGHRVDDPFMNIGVLTSMAEDDNGLLVEADFDMDNPYGEYSHKLVKEGRLYKLSFAYEVLDESPVTLEDGTKANELRKLNVFEVSLVPIPANQHAQVVDAKDQAISGEEPAADTDECANGEANPEGEEPQAEERKESEAIATLIDIELMKEKNK